MAFGIGLGLKEGVGKASEFFAGYAEFDILNVLPIAIGWFKYS